MILNKDYFTNLREQITNPDKWVSNKFVVFNHEAGSGKSKSTFEILGQLCNNPEIKALYVQSFVKDNELLNTIEEINGYAGGRTIAIGFSSEINRRMTNKELEDAQIICISHRMYLQICKGDHRSLLTNRNILIIDEFIDMVEKVSVTQDQIGKLWIRNKTNKNIELDNVLKLFRGLLDEGEKKARMKVIQYFDFKEDKYKNYRKVIKEYSDTVTDQTEKSIYKKLNQILRIGGLYENNAFHTYEDKNMFKFLDNNILLDANGGFDYRYAMSDLFIIHNQKKVFDYGNTKFRHIKINTSKEALSKHINLEGRILSKLSTQDKKGILIVTDIDNKLKWEKAILDHYYEDGESLLDIEKSLGCSLTVDYFGNLIGVNTYRDYDTVIISKTPYFDYLTYALQLLYFKDIDGKKMENIDINANKEFELIKATVVGGEVYQAIKRINRQCKLQSEIYMCFDYAEAFDIILQQFPNIQCMPTILLEVDSRKNRQKDDEIRSITAEKIAKAEKFLLQSQKEEKEYIKKVELGKIVGIEDPSNLREFVLEYLNNFLEKNNMSFQKGKHAIVLN